MLNRKLKDILFYDKKKKAFYSDFEKNIVIQLKNEKAFNVPTLRPDGSVKLLRIAVMNNLTKWIFNRIKRKKINEVITFRKFVIIKLK